MHCIRKIRESVTSEGEVKEWRLLQDAITDTEFIDSVLQRLRSCKSAPVISNRPIYTPSLESQRKRYQKAQWEERKNECDEGIEKRASRADVKYLARKRAEWGRIGSRMEQKRAG
jgi:hypothetical protein